MCTKMFKQQPKTGQKPFIIAHDVSFESEVGAPIVSQLSFSLHIEKTGLVGKNGVGKTTFLRLITGELEPTVGSIERQGAFAYLSQDIHPELQNTVADTLGIAQKLAAIEQVKAGTKTKDVLAVINNDWDIEDRARNIFDSLRFSHIMFDRRLETLSGGERMKVILARLLLQQPDVLILDEPTNNLDYQSRAVVYELVKNWSGGMLIVSHDRELLNLMDRIVELSETGIQEYGGNYDFYLAQREIEKQAATTAVEHSQKELQRIKRQSQAAVDRQAKRIHRAKKLGNEKRVPRILLGAMKQTGETTTARLKKTHEEKILEAQKNLETAKGRIRAENQIRVDLSKTTVPNGKLVTALEGVNFGYPGSGNVIVDTVDLSIYGPRRIAIAGPNGSGKTTLVKLLLGELAPTKGEVFIGVEHTAYLDQHTSVLDRNKTLLANLQTALPKTDEVTLRQYLGRFLFHHHDVFKQVSDLSGGEKMRAALAITLAGGHPPQLLVLDEPTNNLDLNSIEQIESALSNFRGALIVISHDQTFLENIGIERMIELN